MKNSQKHGLTIMILSAGFFSWSLSSDSDFAFVFLALVFIAGAIMFEIE